MKRQLFLFILFPTLLFAQTKQDELEIIELVNGFQINTIYVKESFDLSEIKTLLEREKFKDYNLSKSNTVIIDKTEKNYIRSQIVNNQNFNWDKTFFKDSELILNSEVESYLKNKNQPHIKEVDSILKTKDSVKSVITVKNVFYTAYSLSKPIFFRNGNYCILGYKVNLQSSIEDISISIYKKRRGKWTQYIEIYNNRG